MKKKAKNDHEKELSISYSIMILIHNPGKIYEDIVERIYRQVSQPVINIHHSFLPAFVGANPYRQAYERGVKIIGATAHFVNNNLDEGPIIMQQVIPTDHSLSVQEMSQMGRDVEKITLAKALKLVFDDRIFVSRNKTIIFD
jgi:formyltetrahydrofolate deformylase